MRMVSNYSLNVLRSMISMGPCGRVSGLIYINHPALLQLATAQVKNAMAVAPQKCGFARVRAPMPHKQFQAKYLGKG